MAVFRAKSECDFDKLVHLIRTEFPNYGGISVTVEEKADIADGNSRCSVTAFERFSYTGSNRVGLTVTVFTGGETVHVVAVATGGSQAVLLKLNTFGEEAFMDKFRDFLRESIARCKSSAPKRRPDDDSPFEI